jgi:hypothetical protein
MKPSAICLFSIVGCGTASVDDPLADDSSGSGDATSGTEGADDDTADDDGGSQDASSSDDAVGDDTGTDMTHGSTGSPPQLPGDVLDLHAWKLTLPTGADEPDEIWPPELLQYEGDPCFRVDPATGAVMFVAGVDGVTTENSSYPRCELRELADDGVEEAAWSTSAGRHTMTIVQAITETPMNKPHVVAGQIHDAEDDLVMIRLEGERLFVEAAGDEIAPDLDPAYVLGTEFTVRIVAEAGILDIYYDDLETPRVTLERDTDGCYFKAGAYTQSNEKYDSPPSRGAVAIRELEVTHAP